MSTSFKSTIHVRSNSLPSRNHPQILSVQEQLQKLRARPYAKNLGALKNLFEQFNDLLQLSLAQPALPREQHSERFEQMLDGSLRLMDMCDSTKNVFSQMKECVQQLESSLRRRRGEEYSLENEVNAYTISKMKLFKSIAELSENVKRMQEKATSIKESDDQVGSVTTLREVEESSLPVFESLLYSISRPKARSKINGFALFSKYLQSKQVSCEGEAEISEMEKLDMELLLFNGKKSNKDIDLQSLLKNA